MDGWLVCEWRPWCWTLWSTVVSGAWPSASSVIKPQQNVLVEPQSLWERNCHFLWLAVQNSDIIQGKWEVTPPHLSRDSNYVRLWPFWSPFKISWFSSLHRMDGNRGGISVMLLLLFWGCMWALLSATPIYQLLCLTIDLTFTLSPHTPTDVSHRWEWWMDVYFIEHYMSLMGGNILSVAVNFLCPYFGWTGQ